MPAAQKPFLGLGLVRIWWLGPNLAALLPPPQGPALAQPGGTLYYWEVLRRRWGLNIAAPGRP